jgi:hypothetical protein
MENPDPALPQWWTAQQPESRTDPETYLFSDENLFAPQEEEIEPYEEAVETAPEPYTGFDYASATPEAQQVMEAIAEAVEWLEQEHGATG